jgi:hypothetical protein
MQSVCAKFQGIDTITYSEEEIGVQGNWIKKREWMLQAQELLVEMDSFLTDLQEYDATFYQKKYDEIDKDLNAFYEKIGVGSAAVEELLTDVETDLMAKLNKELEVIKDPTTRERDTEQKAFEVDRDIQRAKASVDQLKADMKLVADFDKAINSRRTKVQEQIMTAQQARQDAENLFDKMTYIIDDTKARAAFYQVKGVYEQLQAMVLFVKTDLSQDTETVIGKTREQIAHTQQEISQLEEQGAVILNRAQIMEELKTKAEEVKEVIPEQKAQPKPERKPQVTTFQNWWSNICFFGIAVLDSVQDLWSRIIGLFTPQPKVIAQKNETNQKTAEIPKPEQLPAPGAKPPETATVPTAVKPVPAKPEKNKEEPTHAEATNIAPV